MKSFALRHILRHVLAAAGMLSFAIGIFASGVSSRAQAQAYPAKPVRLIAPSAPGGGLDIFSRLIANKLSELWGQQMLVENKPGAAMAIGTDYVAKSPADGYTLLFVNDGGLIIGPLTSPNPTFSPRDFAPVGQWVAAPLIVLVNEALPVRSIQELIAELRSKPGKVHMGIGDNNSLLNAELFKLLAKVDFENVMYKGGAPMMQSVIAGETQFSISEPVSGMNAVKSGKVRALAVTSPQRAKKLPDLPTVIEAGVPGYVAGTWGGMLAPAGTPREVVAKLNTDVRRVLAMPEVVDRIEAFGIDVRTGTAGEFGQLIASEADKWQRVIKERNLKF